MKWTILAAMLLLFPGSRGEASDGYVTTPDGVRLYFQRAGSGARTVILPARLFVFEDFRALGDVFTVIAYDMRNRGRSDFVQDGSRLTLEHDVSDLEAVRLHFGIEKFSAVGYSYLGKMVVLYALAHPERIDRLVQIGAVPMAIATEYPANLRNDDDVIDPESRARLRKLRQDDFHLEQPEKYCEEEWLVTRVRLVGDPEHVERLGRGVCSMPNEWPTNLVRHLFHHFGSMSRFDVTPEDLSGLPHPVLTIHGTKDRNAPYGAGREWALHLPQGRLLTIEGAAHQVWADRPEVIDAIRAFLEGRWPEHAEEIRAPIR